MSSPLRPPGATPDRASLQQDARWLCVRRVVGGQTFARSARLTQFLLYVAERTLLERTDEVTEQQVGIHVFGRAPDYNANEDNIVRSQARLLRKKLEEYYTAEGREDEIRILIPKGAYVPLFERAPAADGGPHQARRLGTIVRSSAGWFAGSKRRLIILCGAAVAAATFAVWLLRPPTASERQDALVRQFWGQIFNSTRTTYVVPSDMALVTFQHLAGREVTLEEYVRREYAHRAGPEPAVDPRVLVEFGTATLANQVDLGICWRLAKRREWNLDRSSVRYAKDLGTRDLEGNNAILIGARRANPWVRLFDEKNNFQGLYETRDYILNRAPRPNEPSRYTERIENGVVHSYALVTYVRGLTGSENVLTLSGLTSGATDAAGEFLLNERGLGAFLSSIVPHGKSLPHFEAVLEVERVYSSGPRAWLLAYRVRND